jgi:hypothetical protein
MDSKYVVENEEQGGSLMSEAESLFERRAVRFLFGLEHE